MILSVMKIKNINVVSESNEYKENCCQLNNNSNIYRAIAISPPNNHRN